MLAGKSVVVTGSGAGIGRGVAIGAGAAGANVVVNDIRPEAAAATVAEIQAMGSKAVAHSQSVSTWEGARSLIELCVSEFGRIDGLVNNAGISFGTKPWEEREDEMRAVLETNLMGTLFCGRHAMEKMVAQKSGAIVNMSSRAVYGTNQLSTYSATKGGMKAAAASWSKDLAPFGVRVNVIHPGARSQMWSLWTEINQRLGKQNSRTTSPEWEIVKQRDLDRPASPPEKLGPLTVFLLSDQCDFTGRHFGMRDNNLDIHIPWQDNPGTSYKRDAWTPELIAETIKNHPWP
jgi:NAD(P)-dependent dehydrogenase (short-subunit alcohol dehydrogenase family)